MLWCNDRDFAARHALAHEAMNFAGNVGVFALVGLESAELDAGFFWWIFGGNMFVDVDAWGFAEAISALLDDTMRKFEDWLTGTIILGKENLLWVIFGIKIKEVGGVGALEAIDSLVVITDRHDVWTAFVAGVIGQEADKFCLSIIGVLKLIKENILDRKSVV